MNFKTALKTSVAAAALMAVAAPAFAQDTFMSMDRMRTGTKLVIYGHVNKALLWGDDGNNDRTFIVDNSVSNTRMGFIATAPVNADFSFGAHIEVAIRSNPSSTDSAPQAAVAGVQINNGGTGGGVVTDANNNENTFSERIAEVTMDHKRFGKVSLGQGSTVADGITENYLGGAVNVVGPLAAGNALTGTVLYDGTNQRYYRQTTKGTTAAAAVTLGSGVSYFDGPRDDRVRYDTPRFMGFRASGSFSSGGEGQGGIDYTSKLGQFQVVGGVAYANFAGRSTTQQDIVNGSVAVLHDSGLNASFAAGHRRYKKNWGQGLNTIAFAESQEYHDTGNATTVGGTVGYIAKIFGVGPTAFGVDYHSYANTRFQGSDTTSWGIGVEQTFSATGASVYLGYRNYDVDLGNREKNASATLAGDIDDVNVVIAGVRVLF